RPRIQILAQTRPVQPKGSVAKVYPVSFLLDGQYQLTSVKVVPVRAYETNRLAPPLWHLISYTNVPATEGFLYGQPIPGMRPSMTNSSPQRLEPCTSSGLLVRSGRARVQSHSHSSGIVEPNH